MAELDEKNTGQPVVRIPDQGTSLTANSGTVSAKVEDAARYLPAALKSIEDNFPVSFVVLCVAGYILIAAFGKMDTLGKFIGYIVFLLFAAFGYKLVISKLNPWIWMLLSLLLTSLIIITLQNGWLHVFDRYL